MPCPAVGRVSFERYAATRGAELGELAVRVAVQSARGLGDRRGDVDDALRRRAVGVLR
jgi:hypothetical protein